MNPKEPYSERDDIIVISDEAQRTQAGRLARNMRLALPNAAFVGFRGTPLCKQDEITKPGDPNWRHRVPVSLEELKNHAALRSTADCMRSAGRDSPA